MNHVYRIVFNHSLGVYQCVSELAKSRGKSSGKSQVATKLLLTPLAVAMLGFSGTAVAADVVINDGQRTEYQETVSINGSVLITDSGTVLAAPNNQINFGANPDGQVLAIDTDVSIENNAAVEAGISSTIGVDRFSKVTVDNASLTAPAIAIGGFADGEINITNNGELEAIDKIILGYGTNTTGRLNINNSGNVTTNDLIIADDTNSMGNVVIDGTGSNLIAQNNTFVGDNGVGSLSVQNGGDLTSNTLVIANDIGSSGSNVVVKGAGSNINVKDSFFVGTTEDGSLSINDAGTVTSDKMSVGDLSNSESTLSISDSNSVANVTSSLIVGREGSGIINVTNNAILNSNNADLAQEISAMGEVNLSNGGQWNNQEAILVGVENLGAVNIAGQESKIITRDLLLGGFNGKGIVNVSDNSTLTVDRVTQVGGFDEGGQNAIGELNINDARVHTLEMVVGASGNGNLNIEGNDSHINVDNNLLVGVNSGGIVTMNRANIESETPAVDGNNLWVKGDTILGSGATGNGTLNVINKNQFQTTNLVIGQKGIGNFKVSNTPFNVGLTKATDTTYIGGRGENSANAVGTLTIDNSAFVTPKLIVGNTGSGTLNLINGGVISTDSIERNTASILSNIFIDGGEFRIKKDQSNLFANFTKDDLIEVSEKGISFETTGYNNGEVGTYVVINPNAVITGNAGKLNVEDESGGFAKYGLGTLEISESSKQWTGDLTITQGTLKFNGNYTMGDNETLTIGLLDWNEDGTIDKNYGKFLIDGAVDISKGNLFVYADEVIANVAKDSEWKDIVKATTRVGEFTQVSDNSPLVNFYADYSDPNAVHLKMGAPTPPVVTPEPPVVTPEPPVVTPEPPVVTPEPPVVTPEPPVVTPEPPVVTPEPPVVTPEPPVVTPEPPVVTPEPPVVTPEPPVVTPEPPVTDTTFVESVNTQSQRNDVGIAYALDRAIQDQIVNGDNDLAKALISSTTNFNQNQLAVAANQLQPLFMGAANRIITDTNYAASEAVTEHRATTTERNVWAKLIGNKGSHDAENGVTGYEADSYGAIVGLDTPINSDLNLGLVVSYIDTDADTDGSRLDHKLTAKNWQVLGYGNYGASDATDVNFHIGAGRSSVKGERHLSILTNAVARSDYDVDTLRAGLGVDHRIGSEQRHVTPFAKVNYAQAKSDSYRETGAGVYNLNVDENRYESMRWTAGLKMSQYLTPQFAITGQLAAAIENGDQHSDITANFVGMPNDSFTTIGQEVGREIGIVGIGISYMPTLKTTLSAGYRSEWRENYDDQGASIALQTTF
ncbi:autotransporter domain-containing protein [Psychrobacter alimentarius]|uniref:autotransporter domain-containing protein n=1 Tax=Psychrobacter alimentarius TaxID=261164 RepID=UPI003FD5976A